MPKVFKFSVLYNVISGIIFSQIIIIIIGLAACLEGDIYGAIFVFLLGCPFVCIFGLLSLINVLDVSIGDEGIVKIFLGKPIVHLSWDNVRRIDSVIRTLTPSGGGKSKILSYLYVWPIRKSVVLSLFGGKMIFSSQMAGFNEFSEILNKYGKEYKFKIGPSQTPPATPGPI